MQSIIVNDPDILGVLPGTTVTCPNIQFSIGTFYLYGNGVKKNYAEAAKYYKVAADQGHQKAQISMGHLYRLGYGVTQSDDEATKYYRLAL